jgi:hypothetical protein
LALSGSGYGSCGFPHLQSASGADPSIVARIGGGFRNAAIGGSFRGAGVRVAGIGPGFRAAAIGPGFRSAAIGRGIRVASFADRAALDWRLNLPRLAAGTRLAALMRRLSADRDERSGEEPKPWGKRNRNVEPY